MTNREPQPRHVALVARALPEPRFVVECSCGFVAAAPTAPGAAELFEVHLQGKRQPLCDEEGLRRHRGS